MRTDMPELPDRGPKFGSNEYRASFRESVRRRPSGTVYVLAVFLLLLSILGFIVWRIEAFDNWFWISLPAYFLVANGIEYWLHRYPMHHRMRLMPVVYEHVTIHHNFYADEHFYFEQPEDYYAAILPYYIFVGLSLVIALIAGVVGFVFGADRGWQFALVAYSYYLLYEALHFSYHTRAGGLLKRIPFVDYLSRGHLYHHRIGLMSRYNFNITFPIFDKIFRTQYKE